MFIDSDSLSTENSKKSINKNWSVLLQDNLKKLSDLRLENIEALSKPYRDDDLINNQYKVTQLHSTTIESLITVFSLQPLTEQTGINMYMSFCSIEDRRSADKLVYKVFSRKMVFIVFIKDNIKLKKKQGMRMKLQEEHVHFLTITEKIKELKF